MMRMVMMKYKYQLSQMEPHYALPSMHRAVHGDGR